MTFSPCERCGTTERETQRCDELDVTLCGDCFAQRADETGREIERVELGRLLREIEEFFALYIVLPGAAEETALALWAAHTHALDGAHATPYMLILSPEKRSGKTRVQEVAELVVARPWRVTGASEAAIFRRIAADRPTVLLDEIDAIFGTYSERTEPLRAILNAGNRPGASVARCVGEKGDQVRDFDVFSAKCLAGIDRGERIPDTIRDRAVTIAMRRKTGAEPVERLRYRVAAAEVEPLRERLGLWGEAAAERLLAADPTTPPQLDDRAAEAWEPLFAIADAAGGDWPRRAREAAVTLSASEAREEQSLGGLVLEAIREAFGDEDRISTAELLEKVNADEELPFGGWREGKGLDARKLARLLRPYKVRPDSIRPRGSDHTVKGYLREWFTDAFERWLPTLPTEGEQGEQGEQAPGLGTEKPLEQANVPLVPVVPAVSEGASSDAEPNGNKALYNGNTAREEEAQLLGVSPYDDGEDS